jgi:hypothetical protein
VVDADDGGVLDVGVVDEPVLDLDRVDVLATPQDQVPHSALEVEPAVGDAAEVAGAVPAVVVERRGGGRRIVPVAQEHRRAAQVDLADLAVCER